MSEPQPKPFAISKGMVWEAYLKVKANKGAAGVDGESIEEFERDLKGNLYKLWNRMAQDATFPRRCGWWRYQSQRAEACGFSACRL